jgi:GT2 family glycosyltransferase
MISVPDAADVAIIVPVHNALEYTRQCLESVRRHTRAPYRLIVVDNVSRDGTAEYLRDAVHEGWPLQVITNPENLGCTLALNQGMRATQAEYIILLNNDTVVCPQWVEGLLLVARLDPRIGIVGPKILCPSRGCILATGGLVFTRAGCRLPPGRGASRHDPRFCAPEDRQYIEGSCMLVKREVIERIGLLDEAYAPAYYEDADYSFRARAHGFRTVYSPFSEIYHYAGVTADMPDVAAMLRARRGQEQLFRTRWARDFEAVP